MTSFQSRLRRLYLAVTLAATAMATCAHAQNTLRVPSSFSTIAAAVAAAQPGDMVLIADGTYIENNISVNKAITIRSERGPTNCIVNAANAGRIFIVEAPTNSQVLIQGLTIKNAAIPYRDSGGSLLLRTGKVRLSKSIVEGNVGDGSYSFSPINGNGNPADLQVDNCVVRNNYSANGCGISHAIVLNSIIYNNSAGNNPRALHNVFATNCTVFGNTGGALFNSWTAGGMSVGTAINCIFWGNSGNNGQQIDRTSPANVSYCIVQNGWTGTANLSSDPLFVNSGVGDFRLQPGSPAWNAGDPAVAGTPHIGGFPDFTMPAVTPCTLRRATGIAQVVNGFLVGISITDAGCGYTNTPMPTITISGGGGSGAVAQAVVSNGQVVGVNILNAGVGYTSTPTIRFSAPPRTPSLYVNTLRIRVTMDVTPGLRYQLEASNNLQTWNHVGIPFVAATDELIQDFDVETTGRYFRIREVP